MKNQQLHIHKESSGVHSIVRDLNRYYSNIIKCFFISYPLADHPQSMENSSQSAHALSPVSRRLIETSQQNRPSGYTQRTQFNLGDSSPMESSNATHDTTQTYSGPVVQESGTDDIENINPTTPEHSNNSELLGKMRIEGRPRLKRKPFTELRRSERVKRKK